MKIDFYSSDENVAKWFPPLPAKKVMPEWYKELDLYLPGCENANKDARVRFSNNIDNAYTIKGCIPVQDYLSSGYVLRIGSDMLVTPDDSVGFYWYTANPDINKLSTHPHAQCPIEIEKEKKGYFKIEHTWMIKTPPGYSCLFYQPFYLMEDRYSLFPAIVDTDKHDMPVFFPGFLKTKQSFKLNAGDPFMAVLPFKRDEWQMEVGVKPKPKSMVGFLLDRAYKVLFHSPKKFT